MKKSLGSKPFAVPTPVWAVGAYDLDGNPNAMIAAWGGIVCSQPPSMGVALRKNRHTYEGILKHKAFTISVADEAHAAQADYLGIDSGKDVDKFAATGLTPVRSDAVDAPYVGEFPLIVECVLSQVIEVGVHMQVIGEVVDVKVDEDKLKQGKFPDIERIRPLVFTPGAQEYHGIGSLMGKAFSLGLEYRKK
ncbi:flavin reductase family protein [Salidesulfovibrio onnuriiensis]|uniref:flavin reductase family protein n=1 Tax=Salidesulfovibrio onnuriiensis TaxID=2583823 RepID=UPI0011C797ED|nr:flavin reductase family protein [Salidesulfovibrio onnuriiensis]